MVAVLDRSDVVSRADLVDTATTAMYVAQTFVAEGKALEDLTFFIEDIGSAPLAYRVLVTTVEENVNGFHPGTVLFESGTLTAAGSGSDTRVVVDVGGIALTPGETYAFILDTATDTDGVASAGRFSQSYDGHHGFGEDYADGAQVTLTTSSGFTRGGDFAADWTEPGPSSASDLAFILTFSNPGLEIEGTRKNDRIDAGHGVKGQPRPTADDDSISGGKGKDRIDGLAGDDTLDGGRQKDKLTGGEGEDGFVFGVSLRQKPDKIMDFDPLDDTIVLTGHAFRGLGPGVLAETAFRDVGEAASADDRIVYRANGTLAFDPDGRGGAAAHVFAKLAGAPDVSAGDILVA